MQNPKIKIEMHDNKVIFIRDLLFKKEDNLEKINLYVNNTFLKSTTSDYKNRIEIFKIIEPSSIITLNYSKYHPDFYFFGNTPILVSSERYKVRGVLIYQEKYSLFENHYPYKSDLCFYEYENVENTKQFLNKCNGQKCLNLCDDIQFPNLIFNKNYKIRIKIVGQNSFFEQTLLSNYYFL